MHLCMLSIMHDGDDLALQNLPPALSKVGISSFRGAPLLGSQDLQERTGPLSQTNELA